MSTVSLSASASRFCPLQEKKKKNRKIWDLCLISRLERFIDIKMTYKCQRQAARGLVMAAVSGTVLVLEEDLQHFRADKCCSIVPVPSL